MPLNEAGGGYYFGIDYSREQHRFLRSIAEKVPESLRALKASVLPLFKAAEKDRQKRRYMSDGVWVIKDAEKPEPDWVAIWDWAQDWRLVKPGDVPWLKTDTARNIALSMCVDPAYRRHPYGQSIDWHSSANVFGLATLARVVLNTLETWARTAHRSDPSDPSDPMWTIPEFDEPHPTINLGDIEEFAEMIRRTLNVPPNEPKDMIRLPSDGEHPPYAAPLFTYTFRVDGWNMLEEKRGEAQERITKELAEQLLQRLEVQERIAAMVGLEKQPRVVQEEHFDWLASYQVGKESKYQIAKAIAERSASYRAATTRDQKAALLRSEEKKVAKGIASAAELVIGPDWKSWLVPGQPGRPKQA
jgi:hypothetical protein